MLSFWFLVQFVREHFNVACNKLGGGYIAGPFITGVQTFLGTRFPSLIKFTLTPVTMVLPLIRYVIETVTVKRTRIN
jgi:hypothetical protein